MVWVLVFMTIMPVVSSQETEREEIVGYQEWAADSIIANLGRYADSGEINWMEKNMLASQMKLLKSQFHFLDQIKNNSKFSADAKKTAVGELKLAINKQIDIVVKEIEAAPRKLIDAKAAVFLVDSLMYIKIK